MSKLKPAIVFLLLLVASPLYCETLSSGTDPLEEMLWPPYGNCPTDNLYEISKTIMQRLESALSVLQRSLNDPKGECAEDRHALSVWGIALIGGPEAVNLLKAEYRRMPQSVTETALCFAMASTGTTKDIEFLLNSLLAPENESFDRWFAIEAAAISLGILNIKQAVAPMRGLFEADPSGLLADSLERSVDWIENPTTKVVSVLSTGKDEEIVAAILSCCPLSREFADESNRVLRVYREGEWESSKLENASGFTRMKFFSFLSNDRKRAAVNVMLGNHEYLYLLSRNSAWKVTGMIRVAIYD